MRFGVDAQRLEGQQRLGVGRYIQYLVKYWSQTLAPGEQMTLYSRDPVNGHEMSLSGSIANKVLRPRLTTITWQNIVLARHAREVDVLFCPSYSMPLRYPGRTVLAIHSVNERLPGAHPWWYHLSYEQIYRASAKKADRIIVPCQATRHDLQEFYGIPDERIDVVAQGADD